MKRHLRGLSDNRVGLTIPMHICELFGYTKGMMLYACLKGDELILDKEERTEEEGFDLVIGRNLIQMGASNSLIFPIPQKIKHHLNYYKDQEIDLELKDNRLFVYKIYNKTVEAARINEVR